MNGEALCGRDVHRAIIDKIVAAIEAGVNDYRMPWHRSLTHPVNAATAKPYHGVNVVALWMNFKKNGKFCRFFESPFDPNLNAQWMETGRSVSLPGTISVIGFPLHKWRAAGGDDDPDLIRIGTRNVHKNGRQRHPSHRQPQRREQSPAPGRRIDRAR